MRWLRPLLRWLKDWIAPNPERVTGHLPSTTESCDLCDEVKLTTIEEVWSQHDPVGELYRLCSNCKEGMASG